MPQTEAACDSKSRAVRHFARLTNGAPPLNSSQPYSSISGRLLMADHPQKTGARARPLSPHLSIYRWQVTMLASITHRFTGALAFHLLNGIRHLVWDLGYGFDKHTATQTGSLVYVLSVVLAVAIFAFVWTGYGGYLQ